MTQVPQPLMGRNEAFHIPTTRSIRGQWTTGQHHFQDMEKLFRDLKICLITSVVKGDQDFVR